MLFRYVTRGAHIAIAGKTLAGWNGPTQKVFPPNVASFLNDFNTASYELFAKGLFARAARAELHDPARLLEFRNQMIASFLMYMTAFEEDCGKDHPLLLHVVQSAEEAGISRAQLYCWGGLVRFRTENASQLVKSSNHPEVVSALQEVSASIVSSDKKTRAHLFKQDSQIDGLCNKVDV